VERGQSQTGRADVCLWWVSARPAALVSFSLSLSRSLGPDICNYTETLLTLAVAQCAPTLARFFAEWGQQLCAAGIIAVQILTFRTL